MWVVRGPSNYDDARMESSKSAELGKVWIGAYDNGYPIRMVLCNKAPPWPTP
jgi:hypothetical protein